MEQVEEHFLKIEQIIRGMTYMRMFLGMLWAELKMNEKQLYDQQKENSLVISKR